MPQHSLFTHCNYMLISMLWFFLNCPNLGKFRQVGSYIFFKLMQLTKRLHTHLFPGFNVNNLKW